MKSKILLFATLILLCSAVSVKAQDAFFSKSARAASIPFGKKLPPPDLANDPDPFLPPIINLSTNAALEKGRVIPNAGAVKKGTDYYRQLLKRKMLTAEPFQKNASATSDQNNESSTTSDFHLTRDINALAESNPRNFTNHHIRIPFDPLNDSASYAVLDNVIYFVADDGIHGSELWRSDGTSTGSYMVKDIEPGATSSLVFNITALNGKLYFTGYSSTYGSGAWVSDGTESGTQLLASMGEPTDFFTMHKKVYFIADGADTWSTIWETDGTPAGTKQALEIGGFLIMQPTVVDDLLFFTFLDYETGSWHIWRSDLTSAGTYHVGPAYRAFETTGELTNFIPAQLTNYKHKLYYSANDSTGRKLWVSNGTNAGTKPAPGNHGVLIDADYLGTHFSILNHVLYIPGEQASKGNGLYIYDASNSAGLTKIKDFALNGDTAFIVPKEMQVVNNTFYFKVINYVGGVHDELWRSKGTNASTQLVYKLRMGEMINNLYNGSGILYFVKADKFLGAELWRTFEAPFGTFPVPVADIFRGPTSSYPTYLTAFKGKLIFSAVDGKKGNELFITAGNFFCTSLVKDINTVTTPSSNAGFNFYNYLGYSGMAAIGKDVLFNAYERVHGYEIYKSDGTVAGTQLLNDVVPGEAGFNVRMFLPKHNAVYFLAVTTSSSSIYRTEGTKSSLLKITPDYNSIQSFSVADNGIVYYVVYNSITSAYELWRTDGTAAGTILLSSALYTTNYLNVIGNTALFVAGDAAHGYELWKSNGSVAGTKIVKDINPGVGNSAPGGLFIYNNEAYFSAVDGTTSNPSLWKSNGKKAGTIKLKDIDPWWGSTVASTARYFGVSNNQLYFSAIDHSSGDGTALWKTDGTPAGTKLVKDINPTNGDPIPGPIYLTDVNGTLFFSADDGVHGRELWKSDGTKSGTKLVKDITPGVAGSFMSGLTSFAGKLFFQNPENNRYYLWSSDGTAKGTEHVMDPGITDVGAAAIFSTGDKLFISGYTAQYGTELYVGKAEDRLVKFEAVSSADKVKETNPVFNAILYPNPSTSKATLQLTGDVKNIVITITDIDGKKLLQRNNSNLMIINLPIEKYVAGVYFVTVSNGKQIKTIKLEKQ